MTQLLWTFEDYVRFSQHPERVVRCWAFERLTKQHPDRAAEPLVALLDDVDEYVWLPSRPASWAVPATFSMALCCCATWSRRVATGPATWLWLWETWVIRRRCPFS